MGDWPLGPVPGDHHCGSIGSFTLNSLGGQLNSVGAASTAWPAANLAILVPCRVPVPVTVYKLACGTGTGTTGNFDIGIYDLDGHRLVSTGTTAKTTASSERIVDVTDTLLTPGMYYLAMATDGVTNYAAVVNVAMGIAFDKLCGMRQMATAFVLPSSITLASVGQTYVPMMCAYLRPD